jgi:hypothetical protein
MKSLRLDKEAGDKLLIHRVLAIAQLRLLAKETMVALKTNKF